jgi:hypothetical protein
MWTGSCTGCWAWIPVWLQQYCGVRHSSSGASAGQYCDSTTTLPYYHRNTIYILLLLLNNFIRLLIVLFRMFVDVDCIISYYHAIKLFRLLEVSSWRWLWSMQIIYWRGLPRLSPSSLQRCFVFTSSTSIPPSLSCLERWVCEFHTYYYLLIYQHIRIPVLRHALLFEWCSVSQFSGVGECFDVFIFIFATCQSG